MDEKTVSERHSDNPTVQAFYDELVEKGFGNTVPVYVLPSAAENFREWEVERIVAG